jgi:mono/diheme cytochrome c family protein
MAALGISALAAAFLGGSTAQAVGQPASDAAKPPAVAGPDFPRPPGDPAAIERGKRTFSINCGFCHGSSARGGEGGPNLLRSPIVLNDQNGELVAAVVSNGRPDKGMPKFNLAMDNISDIAAYLHSIDVEANAAATFNPKSVLVGNAAAGKVYFNGKGHCTACHSIAKDLVGIGSKYDPPHLQDMVFTAGGTGIFGEPSPTAPPVTVRVEMPSGSLKGRLIELDDFVVVLIDDGGNRRTIRRNGDIPRIEVDNPLQAHRDLVRNWEDRDLHDLTAYLATLK